MSASLLVATSLLIGVAACAVYWSIVIGRIIRSLSRAVHVRSGEGLPMPRGGWPSVSVVVPVHNEERVLDRCLQSLREQDHPDLQFVIVLDRCTDRSAEIARSHAAADRRIVVVLNESCPPEWAGKCNAARLGAERATGEWILFTDADTRFGTTLVRAAQASALRDGVSLLSLLGRLSARHRFERMVQPVASLTLMRLFPLERVSHRTSPRAFANGQFLLFRRSGYDAVGGHQAVRDDLLEDLAFARLVQRSGARIAVLLADELLEVSMYDSLASFRAGWRRILIESCGRNVPRLRKNGIRIAFSGLLPPLLCLLALGWWALNRLVVTAGEELSMLPGTEASSPTAGAITLAAVAAVWCLAAQSIALGIVYRRVGVGVAWIIGYPVGSLIVAAECFGGARDLVRGTPIRWGGRSYVIAPRGA